MKDCSWQEAQEALAKSSEVGLCDEHIYMISQNDDTLMMRFNSPDVDVFLAMLGNGDFPSVTKLAVNNTNLHNGPLMKLMRAPRSSVKSIVTYSWFPLREIVLRDYYAALSDPHTAIRTYVCNYEADYADFGLDVERTLRVHKVRDQLFVLRRRFRKDILCALSTFLM
jgi:hypothetical protein